MLLHVDDAVKSNYIVCNYIPLEWPAPFPRIGGRNGPDHVPKPGADPFPGCEDAGSLLNAV